MARVIHNRIARFLAILTMGTMMSSIAHANEDELSLPLNGTDPVAIYINEGLVDWDDAQIANTLQIFVGDAESCCEGRTPVAGRYATNDVFLSFTPAFGFEPGQDYVVRVRMSGKSETLMPFSIPFQAVQIDAAVTEIFPSGDILPENTLRFYIHFSTPMTPHVAFDYITLRDAAGNIDNAAFMRFKQELWNEDRTRLTVLIDPGRIKREVATNVELGPALLAGQNYTLSVEGGWPSADGASVLPSFARTFIVSDALRERPDVQTWQAISPCLGTREPLSITFDRPFDRHLLSKDIRVFASDGQSVSGVIQVGEGEQSWSFTPNDPWVYEVLEIVASDDLEDVAGNNFRDLLDHQEGTVAEVAPTALSLAPAQCSD